ncbi:MAG: hypothetical protein A2928_01615 [Candidatus Taylorbacteria bacterium RIFCSPLOWO2_01_FULL_45_15b]|uniref:Uncharacterized protein n=1 Tax=Candidatus Taylorbacteria bacterium RIFCSPLOWO2_01_FULL_45_15b TaxID=1802319 RepID=A0A1G2N8Q4_9BACT|nr:MAG: hypothetical protein A2928_01615 [Candidatus Taylorbacteria bacterium RIFCSPLOWO2_01_FULL_45_15b]
MDFNLIRLAGIWFCGSFVGSVLALHFGYFWWIGCLIGGATGALMESHKRIVSYLKIAFVAVSRWRPNKALWVYGIQLYLLVVFTMLNIYVVLCAVKIMLGSEFDRSEVFQTAPWCIVAIFAGSLAIPLTSIDNFRNFSMRNHERTLKFWKIVALRGNIVVLPFAALWYGVRFICKTSPKFGGWFRMFVREFFRILNSRELFACAVFCTIGSAVGYLFQSPIIGGCAGVLIGILEYRVTRRIGSHSK